MTLGQRLIVFGLDFTMLRILVLFGCLRVILRQEFRSLTIGPIDRVFLCWWAAAVIAYTLLWLTPGALINRLGRAYDAVGMYFLFRFWIRDREDVKRATAMLVGCAIPLAGLMLVEWKTQFNVFHIFGSVKEFTAIREGVLRCMGPFRHPILAGTFGASLLPLAVGLCWQRGVVRSIGVIGVGAAAAIVFTSGSSGPLFASIGAILGLSMWLLRRHMRAVRWTLAISLLGIHVAFERPVWFMFARVSGLFLSGSTGYHRSRLLDQAIVHFRDWWLVGTTNAASWGYYLFDVTNQYVRIAVDGGVLTLALFIALIVRSFRTVGFGWRAAALGSRTKPLMVWSLGVALFTHVLSFFSVSYFDQNVINFYLLLAMIACVGTQLQAEVSKQRVQEASALSSALLPRLTQTSPSPLSKAVTISG